MPSIKQILTKYSPHVDYLELELLIAHILKKRREFILAHPEYKIKSSQRYKIEKLVRRLQKNEPLAYLIGKKNFYGLDFKVNKNVLIPRPETELIVDIALKRIKAIKKTKKNFFLLFVDVGTGSGNIIIALAKELQKIKNFPFGYKMLATDISPKALETAQQNARRYNLCQTIKFYRGSLLTPVLRKENPKLKKPSKKKSIALILANLPYLSYDLYNSAPDSVKKFEPKKALIGGKNGLKHYAQLLRQIAFWANQALSLSFVCLMEISPCQKTATKKIADSLLTSAFQTKFHRDLTGRWRVCEIKNIKINRKC